MKFAVFALAAIATVVSAQRTCDTTKLIQVVAGPDGISCATDSGYSATSGVLPTADQFQKLCKNPTCESYRNQLKAAEPTECLIKGVFTKDTPLYATLITPIETECKKIRETPAPAPGPGPTTAAPTPGQTTAAPSTPAVTPASC